MPDQASTGGVPVTWDALINEHKEAVNLTLESMKSLPQRLSMIGPPWTIGAVLAGPAETLSEAAVIFGPDSCRPAMEAVSEYLPKAIDEVFQNGVKVGALISTIGLLSFLNVTRCCGVSVPPEAVTAETQWLEQLAPFIRKLSEEERSELALAALAANELALVPTFISGGPLREKFQPGQAFEFNEQGFVRYLAIAIEQGASAADIEPAWRDFVRSFPYKYAAGTLKFAHLMWCARTVMVHFEQQPVETVAGALHEFIV